MPGKFDVIVIGAGVAGLAAARDLGNAGRRVLVLEARQRIGGRILTTRSRDWPSPVDLGAEFLHGHAEETMRVARAAGLSLLRLPDVHLVSRHGELHALADFWALVGKAGAEIRRRLKRREGRDFPVSDYLESSSLSPIHRRVIRDFVEGYHAAHIELMSAAAVAGGDEELGGNGDDPDAEAQHRLVRGLDAVPHALRAELEPERVELRTGVAATRIRWKAGEVRVEGSRTAGGDAGPFRARAVVVTVPHALLRAGHLKFEPELPAVDAALARLEAGQVYKVVMRFREAFWTEPGFMKQRMARSTRAPEPLNFVHANDEDVPTWWTSEPLRDPVLTGWAGGPKAESMLGEPEGRRIDRAIHSLSAALAVPRREIETGLEGWLSHDWRADPWSGAAYSYAGVGGLNAHRVLARPIARTICFAGESTSAEETGTVSGALAQATRRRERSPAPSPPAAAPRGRLRK